MSQAKVDKHKEIKKNKKKIVKRQKMNRVLWSLLGVVITGGLVAFIVFSGYRSYQEAHADDPLPSVEVDLSAVTDYETALNTDEEEEATDESVEAEGTEDESTEEGAEETTEDSGEEASEETVEE